MGWNDMIALQTGLIREQQMLEEQKKAAAEAAQSQYLQSMLKQYGFGDPLEVKEGIIDRITPWKTDAEKARPYAEQLLQNSALAVDQNWYNKNVVPNQKTGALQNMEKFGNALNSMPIADFPQSFNTDQMSFQSRNPYQDLSREDLIAKGQQDYSGLGNPEMAQPAARGTQPISGVLEKKTNTEKFLEYLKQSAGVKL